MKRSLRRILLSLIASSAIAGVAAAATTTTTFQVQLTIQAQCTIVSASTLDFGTAGVINTSVDQTSTLNVQCTNTTPYSIGLNAGTTVGGTIPVRLLTGPLAATTQYSLYTTNARTVVWGNTVGVDAVSGIGNGSSQTYTIYGRVPVQATSAPGTYTDTITVTVTY
ncbi:MAG: spore coat U domain-containing protein [Xanthobacteraceae bacterium]|nr:spore coat U domain-containing protein [Xanthobacteraceae bacterium]